MGMYEDIMGKVGSSGFSANNTINMITWILIIIIVIVVFTIILILVISKMTYNKKIIIFGKLNGAVQPIFKDVAREMKIGGAGDSIFYLKKKKKYQPTPTIQTGINTYWLFQRSDGELINFGMADLDLLSKEAGAEFLDKEMRYARVALQQAFKERYDKPSFWDKYGAIIMNIVALTIIMIFLWLIFDKFNSVAQNLNTALQTSKETMEIAKQVMSQIDVIKSGGSGFVKA